MASYLCPYWKSVIQSSGIVIINLVKKLAFQWYISNFFLITYKIILIKCLYLCFVTRICHCDSSCGDLISPCYCSGSLRWVHQICLQHWIRASNSKSCELCRYPFTMRTQLRSPCQWEALPMSSSEKRRFFCSAIFHSIALGCVIWSLYVLIGKLQRDVSHFWHTTNILFSQYTSVVFPFHRLLWIA